MADAGHGVFTTAWADGEYTFRLEWKHWYELQEKCGCGPNELLERLVMRKWRIDDLGETIRLGLIGGGTPPVQALVLKRRYVDDRPLLESVGIATRIVSSSLIGPMDDDDEGKAPVVGEPDVTTKNVTPEKSTSASSTETEPLPGSHLKT